MSPDFDALRERVLHKFYTAFTTPIKGKREREREVGLVIAFLLHLGILLSSFLHDLSEVSRGENQVGISIVISLLIPLNHVMHSSSYFLGFFFFFFW